MSPEHFVSPPSNLVQPQPVTILVPQPVRLSNAQLGALGEEMAATFLLRCGYKILDRNWRDPGPTRGELDLVCLDGSVLVTVEVKTRRSATYGHPSLAVDDRKIDQLRRLTAAYLSKAALRPSEIRFDVVSILLEPFDELKPRNTAELLVAAQEFDHFTAVA